MVNKVTVTMALKNVEIFQRGAKGKVDALNLCLSLPTRTRPGIVLVDDWVFFSTVYTPEYNELTL